MTAVLALLLVIAGAFFTLVAALGVLRLPDLPTRMHAATKAGVIGAGLLLLAVAVAAPPAAAVRALAAIGFLVLTGPVASHAIARAAYRAGAMPLWSGTVVDELRPGIAGYVAADAPHPSNQTDSSDSAHPPYSSNPSDSPDSTHPPYSSNPSDSPDSTHPPHPPHPSEPFDRSMASHPPHPSHPSDSSTASHPPAASLAADALHQPNGQPRPVPQARAPTGERAC